MPLLKGVFYARFSEGTYELLPLLAMYATCRISNLALYALFPSSRVQGVACFTACDRRNKIISALIFE